MSRGWGPWRYDWYSICSTHRNGGPNDVCDRCCAGHWVHAWRHALSSIVYRVAPRLWRWWVNRR